MAGPEYFFDDKTLGLKMAVAIDSYGTEGIAIGGCRIGTYESPEHAMDNARRLAQNMTLKYRVVGLGYGGVKFVIYSINRNKRQQSFESIGEFLKAIDNKCYIATDVGTHLDDMVAISRTFDNVVELPDNGIGSFIPLLTEGIIHGLRAAIEHRYGRESFDGLTAYVLGLGKAGMAVALRLKALGCKVSGYDIDERKNKEAEEAGIIIKNRFAGQKYNIFVPCATGHTVDESNMDSLDADIIGGAENNPLSDEAYQALDQRGITIIPDFVISAGAIVLDDLIIRQQPAFLEHGLQRTKKIYELTREILLKRRDQTTKEKALELLR